jgi:Rap1a immunity proteins
MKWFVMLACGFGLLSVAASAAQTVSLRAETAGQLADLCAAAPGSAGADTKINFCHGFAQGALDDRARIAGDKKLYCFPSPTPGRTATMHDFANWVHALPANGAMPAVDGLFKFLGERYPCK